MSTGKETMTSRGRVLAALDHHPPDRVPIDLGGNQTGIHKNAYAALVRHLGLDEEIQIMDAGKQHLAGERRSKDRIGIPDSSFLKTFPDNFYPLRTFRMTGYKMLLMIFWIK